MMANWQVNIVGKNLRSATMEKLVARLMEELGEKVQVSVKDNTPPSTRPERFQAAMSAVEDAKSEVEGLMDELQEWFDNLPEQFQNADKGEQLQSAISELEDTISDLDQAAGHEVEFPSMM